MTGNLGQQQEYQVRVLEEAKKWSASAKWENDASLLSTVTQNVPKKTAKKNWRLRKKSANEILQRIYDAQFPK